ncbi:MAG TPA: hypothetical protein VEH27_10210 [Methylomirabilota bacterium]|nr:hypothetical protein [Methylomirabilota bacterium]
MIKSWIRTLAGIVVITLVIVSIFNRNTSHGSARTRKEMAEVCNGIVLFHIDKARLPRGFPTKAAEIYDELVRDGRYIRNKARWQQRHQFVDFFGTPYQFFLSTNTLTHQTMVGIGSCGPNKQCEGQIADDLYFERMLSE